MTIQPVISLIEVLIANATAGPGRHSTTSRLTVQNAIGLGIGNYTPSVFCVITCGDQLYATYEVMSDSNPTWDEAFDIEVTDLSPITIRVFHLRRKNVPALIGHTTFLPLDLLWSTPRVNTDQTPSTSRALAPPSTTLSQSSSSSTNLRDRDSKAPVTTRAPEGPLQLDPRPLWKDGEPLQGSVLLCSLSADVSEPIPVALPPARAHSEAYNPTRRRDVQQKGWYFKIGYGKFSKTWYSKTDRSRVRV